MKRFAMITLFFSALLYSQTGARYLIITHDDYCDALIPLADWKTQKGLKSKIVKLSETGSDSTQIRDYVVNAYNTWQIKPEYLLLVGNNRQIPFPHFYYGAKIGHTDNYYTNVTGDFRNEIVPGRFWVYDTIEAGTVVGKVLAYEKNLYLTDTLWYRKGVTIVNEDESPPYSDSVYWADARYTHNLMNNANFLHIDSLARSFANDREDVINAINDGRSYILYRGMGGGEWWPPFDGIHPEEMSNGYRLPIVLSATCLTVEGIGYEWLNAGSPTQPKGVVGFFGTTTALGAAAEMRSALTKGTLESIFYDDLSTLGTAAESGRMRYYELFGNVLEYDSWTCLGDPEMTVRTTTPRQIRISHFPSVWLGETLTVNVTHNSVPVERALVCVMGVNDTSLYHYGLTNTSGTVIFVDTLLFPDTALITVTGRNCVYCTDTVIGGQIGMPFVLYRHHVVLDTISGNSNYRPNNGEEIELAVWIMNFGDSTAHNVTGVIQKAQPDGYFQLSDTVKNFGDIASLDSAFTFGNGFNVVIDQYCPDSHEIKLKLTCRDNDSSWVSYFNFLVYSPRPYMIYKSHAIVDTIGGNGNYQVNPGENIELPVWIQNIGDSIAENVYAIMQKQEADQNYYLNDTLKYFGDISPMDSAWTTTDGYNVLIDSSCPDQHEIKLQMVIKDSLDSLWRYNFSIINSAPGLVFYDYLIDDSVKFMLHGDTSNLAVYIKNDGSFTAENVTGTLISTDTLVVIIDGNATFGNIPPDFISSNQSNPFVINANPQTPPGYSINLKLALNASTYQDTVNFDVYIGQKDYLVWDPDPNHSSGFVIHSKLSQLNYLGDYRQTFPCLYLNIYKTLFVCCGMSPDKYIIYDTNIVIPEIEHFLSAGGKMYLEGGDVWYYDPGQGGYDFSPLFNISPISNNIGLFTGILGVDNTFTRGMDFNYSGENVSIDRIDPTGNGVTVFENRFNNFSCGVAANQKTIGISVELSGLVDDTLPSTKLTLIDSIMHYFGVEPSGLHDNLSMQSKFAYYSFEIYPNPTYERVNMKYQIPIFSGEKKVAINITVYNVVGQLVKTFYYLTNQPVNQINWDGRDNLNKKLPNGVYFLKFHAGDYKETKKVILLR
jgi:hypothetical protein